MAAALANVPASDFVRPAGVTVPSEPQIVKEDNDKKDVKSGKIPNAVKKVVPGKTDSTKTESAPTDKTSTTSKTAPSSKN